jgi:ribose/xylose/arabinose/galactoside ABC-type transport system permease subunit
MKIKNNMFIKTLSTMVIILAITCTTNLNAQGTPGGGPPPLDDTDVTDSIPLDGGLTILLVGAAAFGIKKLRDKKK